MACVPVLYCDSGTCTSPVLWQWYVYVYVFCIVTVVRVRVLYCDSGTCTSPVLWQWCVYVFCIVTVVRVPVLYCDSGTCTCSVLWQWYVYVFCIVTLVCERTSSKSIVLGPPSLIWGWPHIQISKRYAVLHPSPLAQQPLVGQGLLTVEASQSHSDTPHSVWRLWTGHQPDA
jgi:hypothetical protein